MAVDSAGKLRVKQVSSAEVRQSAACRRSRRVGPSVNGPQLPGRVGGERGLAKAGRRVR